MAEREALQNEATIAVLTVLDEEWVAACEVLGCNTRVTVNGRGYRVGVVPHKSKV